MKLNMNDGPTGNPKRFVEAITRSGLSIYDNIEVGDPELWIPTNELQILLNEGMKGVSLAGLPIRTRSKVAKEHVCRILGYPIPKSFEKTQPRFPGQRFDTYVQKSNNLQIWNEELAPSRRYVLIRVSNEDIITRVKIVMGDTLAILDTTGTLTQKYQASCIPGTNETELITEEDTDLIKPFLEESFDLRNVATPINQPMPGQLLPIAALYDRLKHLVNVKFDDAGHDQERNRGAALHRLVCEALEYKEYQDDGRFPDVKHQLLEVKLQTSPTIDLGLVTPNSTDFLDVQQMEGKVIRHCDVRYAIYYAKTDGAQVTLTHLFMTTGERFFSRFPQFQGKVLNKKLQIPLPSDFFDV